MLSSLSTTVAGLTAKTRKKFGRAKMPAMWVMSDIERLPDLASVIPYLPPQSGVIVRHPDPTIRQTMAQHARTGCKAKRIVLLISEDWRTAAALRCDGVHVPEVRARDIAPGLRLWRRSKRAILTTSAHSGARLRAAKAMKADLVFLSPVLPTRSHPDRKALGRLTYAALAQRAGLAVAALGGVDLARVRQLNGTYTAAIAGIGFAIKK